MGIGKRIPSEELKVNGDLSAKEIKVEAYNWSDYVFRAY